MPNVELRRGAHLPYVGLTWVLSVTEL